MTTSVKFEGSLASHVQLVGDVGEVSILVVRFGWFVIVGRQKTTVVFTALAKLPTTVRYLPLPTSDTVAGKNGAVNLDIVANVVMGVHIIDTMDTNIGYTKYILLYIVLLHCWTCSALGKRGKLPTIMLMLSSNLDNTRLIQIESDTRSQVTFHELMKRL